MPDVYQQAFALMEALWQPLIERGVIERATAPQLSKWIETHVGASFPPNPDEPATRHAYKPFHAWDDYRRGALDAYFWGEAAEAAEHEPDAATDPAPDAPVPGLAQLLPRDLFDELCRLLSTTRDARIPEQPYASFGDYTKGLWFYGLHQLDGLDAKKRPQLTDQFCQRGIGPNGELILRSRPFGGITLDATDLDGYRDSSETRELLAQATTADNLIEKRLAFLGRYSNVADWKNAHFNEEYFWHRQYKENRLDTLFDTRQLGSQTSMGDGMRTGLRLALDFAVCLPFAIVCEVEKRLGADSARDEMLASILHAKVREPSAGSEPEAMLLDATERSQLTGACSWPTTALGIAATVTCAIVRLLLGASASTFDALLDHFDYLEAGGVSELLDFKNSYLTEIASWGDVLDMRDANVDLLSYDDLYVAPAFERRHGARASLLDPDEARMENPACVVARMPGRARLLIQAGSGMGKTTYVKGLAAGIARMRTLGDGTLFNALARHEAAAPLMNCTPVLIAQPEAALAGTGFEALKRTQGDARTLSSDEFANLLYRQLPFALKAPFRTASNGDDRAARELFHNLLKAPDALVIVDSIDEVPLAVRNSYIDCLANLAEDPSYNIRRLVVTSRPLEDASEQKLENVLSGNVVRLLPFDLARQRELFDRLRRNHADEEPCEITFEDIAETPGFGELLENPLLLTALTRALLRNPRATAFGVLDSLVELLPKLPDQDPYDDAALAHIAFDMTANEGGNASEESTFRERYQRYRAEARPAAAVGTVPELDRKDIIDRMVTRRGILALRDRMVAFEYTIVRALFACRRILNVLTFGVSERISEEQYDRACSLCRTLLDVCCDPERNEPGAELALLLLLSVRRPYGAWIYENLQTDLYRDLCGFTLNAFGEQQRRHDEAVKLIRASHSFDFGLPCQRNDQIRVWESRLVAFADYYAGDAVDDLEETAPATSCVAEP